MTTRPDFDAWAINLARHFATRATCPRAQVGCVLVRGKHVIASGYNGAPAGMPHCTDAGCQMVDGHCTRAVHAEANAIAQAARYGNAIDGAWVYCTHTPCATCAKLLLSAGIAGVVIERGYGDGGGPRTLLDGGVTVTWLEVAA